MTKIYFYAILGAVVLIPLIFFIVSYVGLVNENKKLNSILDQNEITIKKLVNNSEEKDMVIKKCIEDNKNLAETAKKIDENNKKETEIKDKIKETINKPSTEVYNECKDTTKYSRLINEIYFNTSQ